VSSALIDFVNLFVFRSADKSASILEAIKIGFANPRSDIKRQIKMFIGEFAARQTCGADRSSPPGRSAFVAFSERRGQRRRINNDRQPLTGNFMADLRKRVVICEELDRKINQAASERGTTQGEVWRKALTLYLIALDKEKQGLRVGFARPDQALETEITGL
jgi:hypothetical protein